VTLLLTCVTGLGLWFHRALTRDVTPHVACRYHEYRHKHRLSVDIQLKLNEASEDETTPNINTINSYQVGPGLGQEAA
jgi:hypothetical protein